MKQRYWASSRFISTTTPRVTFKTPPALRIASLSVLNRVNVLLDYAEGGHVSSCCPVSPTGIIILNHTYHEPIDQN